MSNVDPVSTGASLADLNPRLSGAFSPNLYRWLKHHARGRHDHAVLDRVYRMRPGTRAAGRYGDGLFIGTPFEQYEGDTDFSGNRLIEVLCEGASLARFCYPGVMSSLVPIERFWERYLRDGRCAIDPEHQMYFAGGERFSVRGDVRTCLWCGAKQRRQMVARVVHDEHWVSVPANSEA